MKLSQEHHLGRILGLLFEDGEIDRYFKSLEEDPNVDHAEFQNKVRTLVHSARKLSTSTHLTQFTKIIDEVAANWTEDDDPQAELSLRVRARRKAKCAQ